MLFIVVFVYENGDVVFVCVLWGILDYLFGKGVNGDLIIGACVDSCDFFIIRNWSINILYWVDEFIG